VRREKSRGGSEALPWKKIDLHQEVVALKEGTLAGLNVRRLKSEGTTSSKKTKKKKGKKKPLLWGGGGGGSSHEGGTWFREKGARKGGREIVRKRGCGVRGRGVGGGWYFSLPQEKEELRLDCPSPSKRNRGHEGKKLFGRGPRRRQLPKGKIHLRRKIFIQLWSGAT